MMTIITHLSPQLLVTPLLLSVFAVCVSFPNLVPEIAVVLQFFRNAPEEVGSSRDVWTPEVAPAV